MRALAQARTAACFRCRMGKMAKRHMSHGRALTFVLTLAWSATFLVGCPRPPSMPVDAGRSSDVGPRPDTAHDAGGGTAPPLAPCTDTSICADAPGVACLTNVPGGSCTRRCDTDAECGARGTCALHICVWGCAPGSGGCIAHAGACFASTPDSPAYCVPICYPAGREPAGYPACGAGLVCDPYSATCVSSLSTGADNGAPCRDSIECRGGDCLVENDPMPTGFLGGMCISLGVEPSESAFVPGARLAQGSCPDGSAVPPGFAASAFGDLVVCFQTCTSDASCRSGYACTHFEVTSPPFSNGLCMPIDCTSAPCPSGYTCGATSTWLGHPVCGRTP